MVKIFVENTNLPGPIAAVRWCVGKDDMNKLKELNVKKPFLLLVIAHNYKDDRFVEVERKVVSLDQAMEYLKFNRPGKHRVFGSLVWAYDDIKNAEREILRDLRRNMYTPIELNGDFDPPSSFSQYGLGHGSIDVVVPEGHFAPEPAKWEKWWVNLWHESKAVHQCHFRRRRFLAYSLQPPVVLDYVLCRMLLGLFHVLLLLLCGVRNIRYRTVFHPFIYDRWDACPDNISSIFDSDSSGKERHPVCCLFMPIVQIALFGLILAIKWALNRSGLNVGSALMWLLAINAVIVVVSLVLTKIGFSFDKLFPEETKEEREAREKRKLEAIYSQYQDLVCSGVALQPSISSLPSRRRTFYLRFEEIKSKVCLPFAS